MYFAIDAEGTIISVAETEEQLLRDITIFEEEQETSIECVSPKELKEFYSVYFTVVKGEYFPVERAGWKASKQE